MKELSKSIPRRLRDPRFLRNYFVGHGIDIGGKPDPLALYTELFPLMLSARTWDLEDGDAQRLEGVPDAAFDFVHSSHCLEHIVDPLEALCNWFRILRPGGYCIVTVPDEDLYEQGVFPSTYNQDHKNTFTIFKKRSWSPCSINLLDLFAHLPEAARVEKIELLDTAHRFSLPRYDQTLTPVGECAIEFVIRRAPEQEAGDGLRSPIDLQPSAELLAHYNQYVNDYRAVRAGNADRPPFTDITPL